MPYVFHFTGIWIAQWTGQLRARFAISGIHRDCSCFLQHSDRLWDKLILQSREYWGLSPPAGKLRTFPRLRMYRPIITLAHTDVFKVWGLIKIGTIFTLTRAGPRHVSALG